jgi:hypothetical protein
MILQEPLEQRAMEVIHECIGVTIDLKEKEP